MAVYDFGHVDAIDDAGEDTATESGVGCQAVAHDATRIVAVLVDGGGDCSKSSYG